MIPTVSVVLLLVSQSVTLLEAKTSGGSPLPLITDKILEEDLAKPDHFSNQMIVLYTSEKRQGNRPGNRLRFVSEVSSQRLEDFNLGIARLDCATSSSSYCHGDPEQFPRLIIHRNRGENVELFNDKVKRKENLLAYALHYFLLDMPEMKTAEKSKAAAADSSLVQHSPIKMIESANAFNNIVTGSKDAIIVYTRHAFSKEHAFALEMAYHHGFQLPFHFLHNCSYVNQYQENCRDNPSIFLAFHYYLELERGSLVMFEETIEYHRVHTFLFIHTLPALVPSDIVLQTLSTLDQSNLEGTHLTFIVIDSLTLFNYRRMLLSAASSYRSMFIFLLIDKSDTALVDAIPEVKVYVGKTGLPGMITRRSVNHRMAADSGKRTHESELKGFESIDNHIDHIVSLNSDAYSEKYQQQGEEGDGGNDEHDQVQSLSDEEWDDFYQDAKHRQLHIFTLQCDETCIESLYAIMFRLHRSVLSDKVASANVRVVFFDRSAPHYPQFKHYWFGKPQPTVFTGDYTFEAMMNFIDEQTGLSIARSASRDSDYTRSISDDEEAPEEGNDDDEMSMSATSVTQKRGLGKTTTVQQLQRADFVDSTFASSEVIVMHYTNTFAPASKAFMFPFQQLAESMADEKWVRFNWVDCVNLHDICDAYKIKKFPAVVFLSFPRTARRYRGPLQVGEMQAGIRQFRNLKAQHIASMDDFTSLAGNVAPSSWNRPLAKVTAIIAMETVEDDDLSVLDSLASSVFTHSVIAYVDGKLATEIAKGATLPQLIVLKHNDFLQPEVRHSLEAVRPPNATVITPLLEELSRPLISELTPMSFTTLRRKHSRLAVLFSPNELRQKETWTSPTTAQEEGSAIDNSYMFPSAYLTAANKYSERALHASNDDDNKPKLVFAWMLSLGNLASNVLSTFVVPPEMPAIVIIDYVKNEVFKFSHQSGADSLGVDKWVERYLNGETPAVASLLQNAWKPLESGYDFVSRAVERGEMEAGSRQDQETMSPEERNKVRSRLANSPAVPSSIIDEDENGEGNSEIQRDYVTDDDQETEADIARDEVVDARAGEDPELFRPDGAMLHEEL